MMPQQGHHRTRFGFRKEGSVGRREGGYTFHNARTRVHKRLIHSPNQVDKRSSGAHGYRIEAAVEYLVPSADNHADFIPVVLDHVDSGTKQPPRIVHDVAWICGARCTGSMEWEARVGDH